ncbi:copper resistance protein NlpE [Sphingobacterium bovistauri]|uniref:Copper resistance protein NlpE N-terminal domain-containing protein n=1 Tax=Sphingobacterium bovistauri TaxID=2781959 RepID=A0ABS7Z4P4_9SPHI|nr:copper resistance protein NlpE [Sphingobacterium bovistauri]MCA5005119.1 copper resistance protein NlpE N-terminal domain-containing protein [Sphingobacterium bovistauri]
MKNSMLIISTCVALLTTGCQNPTNKNQDTPVHTDTNTAVHDDHNSQNSLDWAGTYQDTIPCADCPGILATIKLHEDGTYSYSAKYLERKTILQDTGRFMWHNNGSVVHLKGKEIDTKYKVGENVLLQADSTGNIIKSEMSDKFSLHKVL